MQDPVQQLSRQLPGLISAVATADHGSFSAAARALGLTPAAVGKNVARLEAQLNLRLFNRTTRSLTPTEEGLRLVQHARQGLAALQQAGDAAAARPGLTTALQGLVRISSASGFGRRYVLPLLPALLRQHPRLQIELVLSDHTVDLVRERFDIGIRGGSEPPQGMVARRLCELQPVLVASPAYLRESGTPRNVQDLASHRLIGLRFLSGRVAAWGFREGRQRVAFEPAAALWLSSPEALLDAVLLHQGIAQFSLHHAWDALQAGQVQRVLEREHEGEKVPLSLFYPHRSGLAPRVRVVLDHLWTTLRQEPALLNPR